MSFVGNSRGVGYMLIAVFFFAVMNVSAKALSTIPAHELVFFRSLFVFFITLWFIQKHKVPLLGNNHLWLFLRGASGLTALLLFFMTLKNIPIASATSLQYLSPIFTVIFASFMNDQRVKKIQWLYFALAFSGILFIKGFDDRVSVGWLGVGVLSSVIAGFAYNSIIKCKKTDSAYTIVIHLTLVSIPVTGIWCLFDFVMPIGWDWLLIVIMGISTQIAQFYSTKALMSGNAAEITPWNYAGAIFSVLSGYLFFSESITFMTIIGIAIIVVALVLNSRVKQEPIVAEEP